MSRFALLALVAPAAALRLGAAARINANPRVTSPKMHCNIYPIFSIKDMDVAKPLMEECISATKTESGCVYYGWTVSQDKSKLFCRETYVDGKAAAAHLQNAVPIVGKMLDAGCVALDSIGVMGTAKDLADVKEEADKLGAAYWEVWDSFSNYKKTGGEESATADFVTIQPTFTLVDKAKAEPFMKECVEATKSETDCVYYGWTICGDKLFCREAYVNGAAVKTHLDNAVPIVGKMLDSGAATLDGIEFHGPASEIAAYKEAADGLGAVYFETDGTFSKFRMPNEFLGMKF